MGIVPYSRITIGVAGIRIDIMIASLILLWLNTGVYTYVQQFIPSFAMYCLCAVWVLIALRNFHRVLPKIFPLIPVVFMFLIAYGIHRSMLTYNYLMTTLYGMIIFLMAIQYLDDVTARKTLFSIWLIDTTFVIINTLIRVRQTPMIVRYMSTTVAAQTQILGASYYGIAKYSTILTFLLVSIYLFYRIIHNRFKVKFRVYLLFVGMLLIIFLSQIGLLIGTECIGLFAAGMAGFIRKKKKSRTFFLMMAVICLGIYYFLPNIIELIVGFSWISDLLKNKALDLLSMYYGNYDNLVDASIRLDQYGKGISAFLSNPMVGSFGDGSRVGGHATWLDMFGMFGILAVLVLGWLWKWIRTAQKSVSEEDRWILSITCGLYLIIGILDPILFSNAYIVLFLILPQLCTWKSLHI